jgi:hypothetical protein
MTVEPIAAQASAERRRKQVFRKGLVTAIDRGVVPWLVTIDGTRQMPYINESIRVGQVVLYSDQDDPFAWVPFGPKIWLSTTIRGGDTTWTALDGDERPLPPTVAAGTADGGIVSEPNDFSEWYLHDPSEVDDLPPGIVEVTVDLSCWWVSHNPDDTSSPLMLDWNGVLWITPPRWFGTSTSPYLLAQDDSGTVIPLDHTTAGIPPYGRGQIRITYDGTDGATEVALSGDGGATWVSRMVRPTAL